MAQRHRDGVYPAAIGGTRGTGICLKYLPCQAKIERDDGKRFGITTGRDVPATVYLGLDIKQHEHVFSPIA